MRQRSLVNRISDSDFNSFWFFFGISSQRPSLETVYVAHEIGEIRRPLILALPEFGDYMNFPTVATSFRYPERSSS